MRPIRSPSRRRPLVTPERLLAVAVVAPWAVLAVVVLAWLAGLL